jgi:hypothetical protein
VSEQGDQFDERDEEQQGGGAPGHGSGETDEGGGDESGGQDRREGTEEGNRESGTGTGSAEQDSQPRQGEVAHEGDLGNEPAPGERAQ